MCCEYPTGFPQGASPTGIPPISPHRQHRLLWMKTALWRSCWRWFLHLPTISPVPHYSQSLTVHTPLTICLQAERFPCFRKETHVGMRSSKSRPLSPLTSVDPNIKAIHIIMQVQMIFSAQFGYFEYVTCLPHGITWSVLR